jgi:putative N6-adenine-specific DNA methylase
MLRPGPDCARLPVSREVQVFEYQKYGRYFAQCAHGMEELVAGELVELGARNPKPDYRGVYFEGDPATLYRINYCSRLISHVLAPLITFQCHSDRYLYKTARQIDWESILGRDQTFVIAANASDSNLHHSRFAAQRLKDAIADHFSEKYGERPSVDRREADLWLSLSIHRNRAIISIDSSGGSLHRRGYRGEAREAPIQETLAAALIRHSGWKGERPLVDPMCGSGTILAEAAMVAGGLPAAWKRQAGRPSFAMLPDYDAGIWESVKNEMDALRQPLPAGLISGSDIDGKSVSLARLNLNRLPGPPLIALRKRDFREIEKIEGATIVTNPPYGKRLGDHTEVKELYREFGDFLKQRCQNSTAWIFCGDMELVKSIGLRTKRRIPLFNGPIECRLVEIPVY